ncbi:hypothetical protein B4589_007100 [Halolamina sp. CBA1230]|uniref:hypothetical protein n=1 Tax=Halolamina sp. CBA1230 TaxID=1853690 RepID=UPI0009A1C398|nr:hypothetical protein [Halolamina sp. CBA1230]QKY20155.1 hypothetical protein B4589_007100 [Halolamina sp. CBA1230]
MTRVWLVDRDVDSRNLVTMTYATPDGERAFSRQAALDSLARRDAPTAAVDVDDDRLDPVDDPETAERYAAEAQRVAAEHDPEDVL